jgi:apolipoprotein N-acyltransferase
VPFGEYVPLRTLLEPFGGESLTSRDAIIGDRPARLDTPAGRFSVAISWEVFFGDRVREGVQDDAAVVLNPTNGSSFTGTLVQTQQVASSRMRAIESDRWLLQVAPTGFSAVVDQDGTVLQRSSVSEQTVLHATVEMREGTTLYTRLGYGPAVVIALASLALGAVAARRARPAAGGADVAVAAGDGAGVEDEDGVSVGVSGSDLDDDGDRSVVDEGDAHVGAEASGGHVSTERP